MVASKLLTVELIVLSGHLNDTASIPNREGGFNRVGQARLDVFPHFQAVDHHVQGVANVLLDLFEVGEILHFPIQAHPREAFAPQLVEEVTEFTLPVLHHRRQDKEFSPIVEAHNASHDGSGVHSPNRAPTLVAVLLPDPSVEDTKVVVNFGYRTDRRAWVVAGRLLFDADCGRQASNIVVFGLLHLAQELAGVRRETLDIATLAFSEKGVEGERRFS